MYAHNMYMYIYIYTHHMYVYIYIYTHKICTPVGGGLCIAPAGGDAHALHDLLGRG